MVLSMQFANICLIFYPMSIFPLQSHHRYFDDAADYTQSMQGPWQLNFEQLNAGTIQLENRGVSFGNAFLYQEKYNQRVRVYGFLNQGLLAFCLPSARSRRSRWWGAPCPESTLIFGTSDRYLSFSLDEHHYSFTVLVSELDFYQCYREFTGESPEFLQSDSPYLKLNPGALKQLENDWSHLLKKKFHPSDLKGFCQNLAQAIAKARLYQSQISASSNHQSQKVRAAISLWKASDYALSVQEVCQNIGVNKRSLEYYFNHQIGYSPYQYLKRHRLNLVRCALLVADPHETTVTQIAAKYGFNEMGRFAGYYRELFGDTPRKTLKSFQHAPAFFS